MPHKVTGLSIQNMVSHDRKTLGCTLRASKLSHRSEGCMHIARLRGGPTGLSPGTPIGRALLATLLNLLPSHVDPPFRQSLHRNRLSRWPVDQQARQHHRVPRPPLDSTIYRLSEILNKRFQSRCGYCCTITNVNFLCKHYAIVTFPSI